MSCKGFGRAFRCGDVVLKNVVGCRRTFTNTARCQKHGAVPAFSETSSPELDGILATFRNKVFLPAHLSKQQQDLIYKKKNQRLLSVEPVTARISGEDFQLEHIDKVKDLPNTRRAFFEAVDLMKEKRDWDQIPNLLQGLKNAGTNLKPHFLLILIRKAAVVGRMDVMIECARRVDATGFRLNDPELVAALMWGIQCKAITSEFEAKETKKALAWAEMLLVIMEEDRHAGRRVILESDPRRRLEVVGAPLQLAAVRAAKHLNLKDEHGMVQKYAERAVAASLGHGPPLQEEQRADHHATIGGITSEGRAAKDSRRVQLAIERNAWLRSAVPILHGMKVAQLILQPASHIAVELKSKADALETIINAQRELLLEENSHKDHPFFGLFLYDQLLGQRASSA